VYDSLELFFFARFRLKDLVDYWGFRFLGWGGEREDRECESAGEYEFDRLA
jgi:hypothetical protein